MSGGGVASLRRRRRMILLLVFFKRLYCTNTIHTSFLTKEKEGRRVSWWLILSIKNLLTLCYNSYMDFKKIYMEKNKAFRDMYGSSTPPKEFYRDLFPKGSFERAGHQEDKKPNGILVEIDEKKNRRNFIFDDLKMITWKKGHKEVIIAPVGYYGLKKTNQNASKLFAFVFDLDGVGLKELQNFYYYSDFKTGTTLPTYIVNSGQGLHLYYMLTEPLPLRQQDIIKLNSLKRLYTNHLWMDKFSSYEEPQYQGVTQGFRMVGSMTKTVPDRPVIAFKTGDKFTYEELQNKFLVNDAMKEKFKSHTKMTTPIIEAQKKWPVWYQKRIIEKKPTTGSRWNIKRDLYDWWLRKIKTEEKVIIGHRYFRIMVLVIYAIKCNIEKKELSKDAYDLIDIFNNDEVNPFTKKDVKAALNLYDNKYLKFTRATIASISAIDIPPNKRNGRPQKKHMELARAARDIDDPNGNFRRKKKYPKNQKLIQDYQAKNPTEENKSKVARELKLTRKTVAKHWSGIVTANEND
jgi:hypothetical protein